MAGIEYRKDWDVLASYFAFKELSSAPATPETNVIRLYGKDSSGTSTLCYKNDAGTEVCFPTAGPFVTGAGVANRLAYWTSTSVIDDVPRTFTAGSVLFAGSDFLPQEDNTNFFWDDTNNRLGIGTNSPQQVLHTVGVVRNAFTSGQSYDDSRRPGDLRLFTIQSKTAGAPFQMEWYTNDGDGTDNIGLNIFAKGLPSSLADLEALQIYYDASAPKWIIGSANNGAGTVRPIYLYTGANTSQLVLTADGNNAMAGHLTIGGGATASELRFLEPSGGGTSYAAIKAPALAANYTLTLPVDDGAANQVLQTDGSGVLSWVANGGTNTLLDGTVHTDTLASTVTRGDIIYGNSTPKWARLAKGSAGAFLRGDGTDTMWSTLILPNAATANYIPYATGSNTWGESANLQYDGTDFIIGSGTRARMSGQNRFRHLNTMARASRSSTLSVNNTTITIIDWDQESTSGSNHDHDTDTLHDTATNPSRFDIRLTGKYLLSAATRWNSAGTSTGTVHVGYRINGVGGSDTNMGAMHFDGNVGSLYMPSTSQPVALTSGDYVEFWAFQNNSGGGALTMYNGDSFGSVTYLGE